MDDNLLTEFPSVEFAENPEQRCAVVLLLDRSESMKGEKLTQLNKGLSQLKIDLSNDTLAASRVEIAIVTFGPVEVMDVRNGENTNIGLDPINAFVTVDLLKPITLSLGTNTPMGEAVELGLNLIKGRKKIYKENAIEYYRPWMILITDGYPTDRWNFPRIFDLVKQEENQKGIIFFGIGVEDADMETLAEFSEKRPPIKLDGLKFNELFKWVSNSLSAIAQSKPGDQVPLPPASWGSVETSS